MIPKKGRDTRSGRFVPQGESYAAFVPKPLPPSPPLQLEAELLGLLEQAGTELGRLDGIARVIPDPDFLLLKDGRGSHATPGEFRKTQNWIGPDGARIEQATFVPPPVPEMEEALGELESFLNEEGRYSTLIEVGLAHAQFETIHPFLDGNGRVGRLLNTFLLVQRGVLRRPLLYLSYYFKLHRTEYYDRLMAIRLKGDWEGWLRFFLQGVVQTAREATATAGSIFELREHHRAQIIESGLGDNALRLLSELFQRPLVTVNLAARILGTAYPTASRLVLGLEEMGILEEITGRKRSRIYRYEPYVSLFDDPPADGDNETTAREVKEAAAQD
jgi:Fic family protein